MSCFPKEEIVRYVTDQLDEETRETFENHLYDCDRCLAVYIDSLEQLSTVTLKSDSFTDDVIARITKKENEKKRSIYQPLIHYAIAAGFTLLLTVAGVFEQLTNLVPDEATNHAKSGSISDFFMERTVEVFDKWNAFEKEETERWKIEIR